MSVTTEPVTVDNLNDLVFGGLFEVCSLCINAKIEAEQFCLKMKGVSVVFPQQDTEHGMEVFFSEGMRRHIKVCCPQCCNTGWVPTVKGKGMLWVLSTWLKAVHPEWQRWLDEIPF
jgi:hypothetical protein